MPNAFPSILFLPSWVFNAEHAENFKKGKKTELETTQPYFYNLNWPVFFVFLSDLRVETPYLFLNAKSAAFP
jgi:hypothetical protein